MVTNPYFCGPCVVSYVTLGKTIDLRYFVHNMGKTIFIPLVI